MLCEHRSAPLVEFSVYHYKPYERWLNLTPTVHTLILYHPKRTRNHSRARAPCVRIEWDP